MSRAVVAAVRLPGGDDARASPCVALAVACVLASDWTAVWLRSSASAASGWPRRPPSALPVPPLVTIAAEAALIGMPSGLALARPSRSSPSWPSRRSRRRCDAAPAARCVARGRARRPARRRRCWPRTASPWPPSTSALTWTIFSLGLALIGSFIHATYREPDPLDSYRNAQRLIRELIGLSDELNRGLEPVTLAAEIASAVHDELPVRGLVVHVPRGEQLTPIINDHGDTDEEVTAAEELAATALLHDTNAHRSPRLRPAAEQRRRHRRRGDRVPLPRSRPRRPGPHNPSELARRLGDVVYT